MARGIARRTGQDAPPAADTVTGGTETPPMPPSAPPAGAQRLSEQDRNVYHDFLGNAIELAYSDDMADTIASQLTGPQPVEALAETIATIVNRIGQDGRARGIPVKPAMAVATAATLAGDIGIEMAQRIGREPLNADQIQGIVLRSSEILLEMQGQAAPEGGQPAAPGPAAPANGLVRRGTPTMQ